MVYTRSLYNNSTCSICIEHVEDKSAIWCQNGHAFHGNPCLEKWKISTRSSLYRGIPCPVCKSKISIDHIK